MDMNLMSKTEYWRTPLKKKSCTRAMESVFSLYDTILHG